MFLFWLGARRPWGFPWLERRPGAKPSNRIGPAVSSVLAGEISTTLEKIPPKYHKNGPKTHFYFTAWQYIQISE